MRFIQHYWQSGKFIKRVYKKKPGRPKGVKNSTYNLSKEGLLVKQEVGRKLVIRLRKEGRVGSGYFKNHPYPQEAKDKVRASILKLIVEGKLNPAENVRKFIEAGGSEKYWNTRVCHGTHGLFYSKKNKKKLRYDSQEELERMHFLETHKLVSRYEKAPLRILYWLDEESHYYYPDFMVYYVDGTSVLEEIKPKGILKIKLPKNIAKFKAARKFCRKRAFPFRVLTEEKLSTLV